MKETMLLFFLLMAGMARGQAVDEIETLTVADIQRSFDGGSLLFSFETNQGQCLALELINRLKVDGNGKVSVEGADKVLVNYIYSHDKRELVNNSGAEKKILKLLRQTASQLDGEEKDYLRLFAKLIQTRNLDLKNQLDGKKSPSTWRRKPQN